MPGLALGVVRDGKVVYEKAYGYADPVSRRKATTRTLFSVGSITKSFTVTAMAMLADGGRLDWDRPVRAYVPRFRLLDPEATKTVTARDLVTHRTGMPRHDVLWYTGAYTRREMMRRLRHLRPTTKPREAFQYNNLMYMAAGYVAGRVASTTWEHLTERRILKPLGMASTRLRFIDFLSSPEAAMPYFGTLNGRVHISPRNTNEIGPAASIYSDISDMIRYLRFHIDKGEHGGQRLLSQARSLEMQTPQIMVRGGSRYEELGATHYGMGFYISSYRGRKHVYHSGFMDGFGGLLAFLPDEKAGVVVLTNLSGQNPVPKIIARLLYDRLLGLEPVPWLDRYIERRQKRRRGRILTPVAPDADYAEELNGLADFAIKPVVPKPRKRRALRHYAGIYHHPGYGPIQIWAEKKGLAGRFHNKVFPLKRVRGDTWRVPDTVWPIRHGLRFNFLANDRDIIDRLGAAIADGPTYPYKLGDIIFRRGKRRAARR